MASILKKIGLHPVIFLEPSHAYIGYYKDKKKKKIALLETTLAGNVKLSTIHDNADSASIMRQLKQYSKYMTQNELQRYSEGTITLKKVKENISRESFRQATNHNIERFEKNKKAFSDPNNAKYSILDIDELREKVQPITREADYFN